MKIVIVLLALFAFSYGYNVLEHNNGRDILDELEGNNKNVYVLLFQAGATEGSALANRNDDYENALISRVLENYPDFWYSRVDANNRDYEELVSECGIDDAELQKSPSILMIENGNGAWIHGPQTITKLEEYAPAYDRRSRQ